MKKSYFIGLIIAVVTLAFSGNGASASTKKKVAKVKAPASKLSTDIQFNDSLLHGRYQTPDEATARVENEKVLSDLLAVRPNFKDRLHKASEQN